MDELPLETFSIRLGETVCYNHSEPLRHSFQGKGTLIHPSISEYCYLANSTDASFYGVEEIIYYVDARVKIRIEQPIRLGKKEITLIEDRGVFLPSLYWAQLTDTFDTRIPYGVIIAQGPEHGTLELIGSNSLRYVPSLHYFNFKENQTYGEESFKIRVFPFGQPTLYVEETIRVWVEHQPTPPDIVVPLGVVTNPTNISVQLVDYDQGLEQASVSIYLVPQGYLFFPGLTPTDYLGLLTSCRKLAEFPVCSSIQMTGYPSELNVLLESLNVILLSDATLTVEVVSGTKKTVALRKEETTPFIGTLTGKLLIILSIVGGLLAVGGILFMGIWILNTFLRP